MSDIFYYVRQRFSAMPMIPINDDWHREAAQANETAQNLNEDERLRGSNLRYDPVKITVTALPKTQPVAYGLAKVRVIEALRKQRAPMMSARHLAGYIWPGHTMKAYGAAGAANHVLKAMETEGLLEVVYHDERRDWRLTKKGKRFK